MTPEEMSELAECLQDACDEHIRSGGRILSIPTDDLVDCRCPFGALLGDDVHYPLSVNPILEMRGIPRYISGAYMSGFDGRPRRCDQPAEPYQMGVADREKYS